MRRKTAALLVTVQFRWGGLVCWFDRKSREKTKCSARCQPARMGRFGDSSWGFEKRGSVSTTARLLHRSRFRRPVGAQGGAWVLVKP